VQFANGSSIPFFVLTFQHEFLHDKSIHGRVFRQSLMILRYQSESRLSHPLVKLADPRGLNWRKMVHKPIARDWTLDTGGANGTEPHVRQTRLRAQRRDLYQPSPSLYGSIEEGARCGSKHGPRCNHEPYPVDERNRLRGNLLKNGCCHSAPECPSCGAARGPVQPRSKA
jgi:hypothetical protein